MNFLDNLSISLLQLCDAKQLSYKQAAELCNCSPQHFRNIIRKQSVPSLTIFEQICNGFQATPNFLLGQVRDYRAPIQVSAIRLYHFATGDVSFPICPRCNRTLEREYQSYCDRCGQHLSWKNFDKAVISVHP